MRKPGACQLTAAEVVVVDRNRQLTWAGQKVAAEERAEIPYGVGMKGTYALAVGVREAMVEVQEVTEELQGRVSVSRSVFESHF